MIKTLLVLLLLPLAAYADEVGNPMATTTTDSAFASKAEACGKRKQEECRAMTKDGSPVCGRAIGMMVACMAEGTSTEQNCKGGAGSGCGTGGDYVTCSNGFMEKCNYAKIPSSNSKLCYEPGAVRAYSPESIAKLRPHTENGAKYGHAEFVCGSPQYCSVYPQAYNAPWPTNVADGCWYPINRSGGIPYLGPMGVLPSAYSGNPEQQNPSYPNPYPSPYPEQQTPRTSPDSGLGTMQGLINQLGARQADEKSAARKDPKVIGYEEIGCVNAPVDPKKVPSGSPIVVPKGGNAPILPERTEDEKKRAIDAKPSATDGQIRSQGR